jgi:hypothetical protein
MSKIIMAILFLGLVLAPLAFAGCASDSYRKACASCSFDQYGKMDQSCWGGYKASGTTCVSVSYPIMAGKYAEGKCPAIDSCASELQSCVAQYGTGDDKADCQEGSLAVCYAAADVCTKQAAVKCGEIESPCPGSSATFILLFAGLFYVRMRN